MTLLGQGLWVVVYVIALWAGWQMHRLAIPLTAVVINTSWEWVFAIWHPPSRRSARWFYRTWLLLDLAILAQALIWCDLPASDWGRGPVIGLVLAALCIAVASHEYLYRRFRSPEIVAFVANLIMSGLFCASLVDPTAPGAAILGIALLKAAGTGVISLANLISGAVLTRRGRLLLFLMPSIAVLDAIYIVALWRR